MGWFGLDPKSDGVILLCGRCFLSSDVESVRVRFLVVQDQCHHIQTPQLDLSFCLLA